MVYVILKMVIYNISTEGDIITSNITTNDINLNLPGGRSLSVLSNLEDKASYTDVFTLSGVIYSNNNNNNIINYELNNNLYNSTLSNLIYISTIIHIIIMQLIIIYIIQHYQI